MKVLKKIIAGLMILISIISLAISLFIIVQLWKNHASFTEKVVSTLTSTSQTLETTAEGLVLVNNTLGDASTSIKALSDTTLILATNVDNTSTTIDSFSVLFNEEIPTTITNTQTAIITAQTSAAVIDGVLIGLSNVPLIGIEYDPAESLSVSLGKVAASLEPLPKSIRGISDDLDAASTSLLALKDDLQGLSIDVLNLSLKLDNAQDIVEQYQGQLEKLQTTVNNGIDQAPNWIKMGVWGLTFLIIWLIVAQLGLLAQGIYLMTS